MNIILKLLIFCIVLFIYIHICFYLKTSDDLEVYEIEQFSKSKLEDICDLRQPVVFNNFNGDFLQCLTADNILKQYGAFDMKIQESNKYPLIAPIPFPLKKAKGIISDVKKYYISENNEEFLTETGLHKELQQHDSLFRPYLVSNCVYDIKIASENATTPLRYDLNYRNFYCVVEGAVTIKLAPPKNTKYLYLNKDYDSFQFTSPINPWDVQEKYLNDYDKIKFLEIKLEPGKMLFIPAYWWYSIKFDKNSMLCLFSYRTYMNNVALLPEFVMKILQSQNIKHLVAKKMAL